jgi:hypothetical protein
VFIFFQKTIDIDLPLWDIDHAHGNNYRQSDDMRTKMLALTAAAVTAGFLTASAQVYSINTVGYINLNLSNGFNLVANQLDVDGFGTNNTLQTVFGTNFGSVNASIYAFSNGAFVTPAASWSKKSGWTGGTAAANWALNKGKGVFVQVNGAATITLSGNVLQGSLATPYPGGFNVLASQVPQGGKLQTDLGYAPNNGDNIIRFNVTNQAYISPFYSYSKKSGWTPSEPVLNVGEAFWLQTGAGVSGTWSRNFTVQ